MIVTDRGDAWDVVPQTDHASLSGQLAAAWGNDRFASPTPLSTVVTAAARHDDGWAVWERGPEPAAALDARARHLQRSLRHRPRAETHVRPRRTRRGRRLVDEEERRQDGLAAEPARPEGELWTNYKPPIYDRLSLYCST